MREQTEIPEREADREDPQGIGAVEGDFRGSYGFGRPAHRPDPQARYVFQPEISRVLPIDKRSRWR